MKAIAKISRVSEASDTAGHEMLVEQHVGMHVVMGLNVEAGK